MNFKAIVVATIFGFSLLSCSSTNYYQLYKAVPQGQLVKKDSQMVYEDQNCEVTYNLWSAGGNAGFKFYNKTSETIYLNFADSYFVLNGVAYDYFKNRITTQTTNETRTQNSKVATQVNFLSLFTSAVAPGGIAVDNGLSLSQGYSVAYQENKVLGIPPGTSRFITEFSINTTRIKNCNLLKYPSKRQVQPTQFTKSDSPFTVSNLISYSVGNAIPVKFENSFYISEISNHPDKEFAAFTKINECNEERTDLNYKYAAPDCFYIKYLRGVDMEKH
ncbi:MAG: hypothetical protein ACLGH8_11395 [Bacteroidia bacterium]